MEKIFHLKQNGTTVRTEIRAGLTTFFAMAYIIFVNPSILSATGMNSAGVMIATCVSAAIGSALCALFSNQPYALAAGMGLNTFFAFTLCNPDGYGYTWQQALGLTLLAGFLFLIITITPLRSIVIQAVPKNLKHAISAGMGLFIALIGLLNAGLITMNTGFPALGDLKSPACLLTIFGLVVTSILVVCHVQGSLILGMLATVLLSLITGQTALPTQIVSAPTAFGTVFMKLRFSGLLKGSGLSAVFALTALLFTMTMIDMFDTVGFLIGASSAAGTMDEQGNVPKMGQVLAADAASTMVGALCGTSTVTSFAESSTGISAGGRTDLTSVTTGVCFLLAVFFAPLTGIVSSAATSPALIIVGMYMLMDVRNIDFSSMDQAIPAFLTILMMPMSYSITAGIGIGFIAHVICKLAARKTKELNPAMLVIGLVFLLYFCL
ncbi:MAG: NCS2 family permease [Eubacteriales bacterium]|nr:NCS2 family permease [Eubacteriales bacterium]